MMMKYSTYRSIYDTNKDIQTYVWRDRMRDTISQPLLLKLLLVMLLLIIGCTGAVSAFSGKSDQSIMMKNIIIQPGDTLWKIAVSEKPDYLDTRVYIKEMKEINGLSQSGIRAGEVLSLPQY
ncbi:hypothetical protein J2T13_002025 [Paenibacillus sp. DS2015]|uniref:LysM peptidoglycan-binding domain-containing protein n=1 Tax=Paenibacillus sp. DS2015 TaxID=3373917 RepID=UPI003D200E6B